MYHYTVYWMMVSLCVFAYITAKYTDVCLADDSIFFYLCMMVCLYVMTADNALVCSMFCFGTYDAKVCSWVYLMFQYTRVSARVYTMLQYTRVSTRAYLCFSIQG